MKITAIRADRVYREMMNAAPAEKENIYRDKLMKPFEYKWACVGIPLKAETEGGYVCGYALIGHYLKKTGASIYKATITPTEEILKQTEDFWQ